MSKNPQITRTIFSALFQNLCMKGANVRSEFVHSRRIFNSSTIAWGTKLNLIFFFKLQSVSFASLSPSMFENLELPLFVQLCSLRGLCSGADESNVLR